MGAFTPGLMTRYAAENLPRRPWRVITRVVKTLATLVSFACLLSVAGCSGDDEERSPLASVEGFCSRWADLACSDRVLDACESTRDRCVDRQGAFCRSIVPAGKYSRDGARACLDAVERAYVDAALNADEYDVVRQLGGACEGILSGTGGPGDVCAADDDCHRESGLRCILRPDEVGTCQEPEVVGGGFACSRDNQLCTEGFYCNGQNCIALPTEGAACSSSIPCAVEYKCVDPDGEPPTDETEDATCEARLENGAEGCEENNDCVGGFCIIGSAANICSGRIQLTPGGPICQDLR
jgi:hypothetical protein